MCLLSEIGKGNSYERPENMFVIKRKNISYDSYFNQDTQQYSGLLNATIYHTSEIEIPSDGELVDYRKITGLSK